MARIRQIKPEFWHDPIMVGLKPIMRLFYIGVWNQADDDGLLEDKPADLKMRILPNDSFDAVAGVQALVDAERLRRWTAVDRSSILQIVNFHDHQVISRPSQPKLLTRLGYKRGERIRDWTVLPGHAHGALMESSVSTHGSPGAVRVGVEVKNVVPAKADDPRISEIHQYWSGLVSKGTVPRKLTTIRRRRVAAALKRFTVEQLKQVIAYQLKTVAFNDQGVPYDDIELFLRDEDRIQSKLEAASATGFGAQATDSPSNALARAKARVDAHNGVTA